MADFNKDQALERKNNILKRISAANKSIKADVVDYYWDSVPQTQEDASKINKEMYSYLETAYNSIGSILSDMENYNS